MEHPNYYAPPAQPPMPSLSPLPGPEDHGATGFSSRTVVILQRTRPWLRSVATLFVLGAAFFWLAALGNLLGAAGKGGRGIGMAMALGVVGYLFFYPALQLYKTCGGINRLIYTGHELHLETALIHLRNSWRYFVFLMAGLLILMLFTLLVTFSRPLLLEME